jgi:hypothetical protein
MIQYVQVQNSTRSQCALPCYAPQLLTWLYAAQHLQSIEDSQKDSKLETKSEIMYVFPLHIRIVILSPSHFTFFGDGQKGNIPEPALTTLINVDPTVEHIQSSLSSKTKPKRHVLTTCWLRFRSKTWSSGSRPCQD